jgi:hypothetical protein
MVAVRWYELELAAADQDVELLPVPLAPEVRVSHAALLAAVQVTVAGVTMRLDAPELASLPISADGGWNWKLLPGAVSGSNRVTEYEKVCGDPLISTFASVTVDMVSVAGAVG